MDVADGEWIVGVGTLAPLKGWALAIDAIASMPEPRSRLLLVGTGPDEGRLRARAQRRGVADRVRFAGHLPRDQVFALLTSARALLFPSFHDSAGWAVAEALTLGCPVVCLDLGDRRTCFAIAAAPS
ncbi:glycosyltransferase [Blastococcus brunescens]|uniref:glycosyltransferase n=1 Tax=Blastococcus brunescens TaxID=1564165 RepID=UPI003BEED54F